MKLVIFSCLLSLLVFSCNQVSPDHENHDISIPEDYNFSQSDTLQLTGTEPFWSIILTSDNIRYSSIDSTRNLNFTGIKRNLLDTLTFFYSAKNAQGEEIEITLHKQPCSDGMSDIDYDYCTDVKINRKNEATPELLRGCGNYR